MKNDLNVIREWKINKAGDIFIFGIKGSGKTCKLLTFAQSMYDNKHIKKVWDMFGGDRDEGPFWVFPNRDYNLWDELEKETYPLEEEGPKQYKITYAKPLFSKQMSNTSPNSHTFCIAPMLDWTDRHARFFLRCISQHVRLYTEMVTTGAIIYGDKYRHLAFNEEEHPVALQPPLGLFSFPLFLGS